MDEERPTKRTMGKPKRTWIERVGVSGHLNKPICVCELDVNTVDNCFNVRMCVVINRDFTLHAVTSVVF